MQSIIITTITCLLQCHPQVEVRVGDAVLVQAQARPVALDGLGGITQRLNACMCEQGWIKRE